MAVKSLSVRIEEEMLEKLDFLADYEGRSLNSHILVLIRDNIDQYEAKYGEITGEVIAARNVKPPRKKRPKS